MTSSGKLTLNSGNQDDNSGEGTGDPLSRCCHRTWT